MALAAISSSAYLQIAHGTLNWDTALRTDVQALVTSVNSLTGSITGFSYAGSVKDWNLNGGWGTNVEVTGNTATAEFGFDPGSAGLSTGSSNNLVGTIASGSRPSTTKMCRLIIAPSSGGNWNGSYMDVQVGRDGSVYVSYVSTGATVPSGALVTGQLTYRVN